MILSYEKKKTADALLSSMYSQMLIDSKIPCLKKKSHKMIFTVNKAKEVGDTLIRVKIYTCQRLHDSHCLFASL